MIDGFAFDAVSDDVGKKSSFLISLCPRSIAYLDFKDEVVNFRRISHILQIRLK